MANLRDIPRAIHRIGAYTLGKRVVSQVMEDDCFTLASSMAYSWLFAVFPFFIFLLGLIPYVPGVDGPQADQVIEQVISQFPKDGAATLRSNIDDLRENPRGGLLSLGIILALWVASGGVATTMGAIAKCYDVDTRPIYKQRPLAMGLTVIVVAMVLSVIILLPVSTAARAWISAHPEYLQYIGGSVWPLVVIDVVRYLLALALLFGALSVLYYFGPPIKQTYRFITPGAVFVVLSWMLLGLGLRFYVNNFGNYNATYGAVGGVIILLFVFYLDSLMLLIGAEINSEIDIALRPPEAEEDDFTEDAEVEGEVVEEVATQGGEIEMTKSEEAVEARNSKPE